MNKLIQQSTDVYCIEEKIFSINHDDLDLLRTKLSSSTKGRVRINLHPKNSDLLHEMMIVLSPNSYIRPHKHPEKSEAFHLVYGKVDVVIFNQSGEILKIIPLAANDPSRGFYYRMSESTFHTLLVRSDILIVHEITNGPFIAGETIYAEFAPKEEEYHKVMEWQNKLNYKVLSWSEG